MGETVQLTSSDGFRFPAYVARPAGPARGSVVVLQEIFGVNAHIRSVADGYAAQGYVALAPATFHRVRVDVELGYTSDDIAVGRDLKMAVDALPPPGVLSDIQSAIAYGTAFGKVGVVGYCWGGLLAWRTACLCEGVSAAVCYYGGGMTAAAEVARKPACPVLAHFGDQDPILPLEGVEAFRLAQPGVQVVVYPAQHGFNCDHRASFDAGAANIARQRTLDFFTKNGV